MSRKANQELTKYFFKKMQLPLLTCFKARKQDGEVVIEY